MAEKTLTADERRQEYMKKIKSLNEKQKIIIKGANQFEYKAFGSRYFTGEPAIDILTNGGAKCGGFFEITGENDCGKTSLMQTIVSNQHNIYKPIGLMQLVVDGERNWTQETLKRFPDCDWDNIAVLEPSCIEEMFDVFDEANADINYIDSIPSIVSKEALKKDMDKAEMAVNARQYARGWNKSYSQRSRGSLTYAVNQLSATMNQYEPKTTKGGGAIKYLKNYAIHLRKSTSSKNTIGGIKKLIGMNYAEGNVSEVKEVPFAYKVIARFDKSKFGGTDDDERILYLRQSSETEDENYDFLNNRPGSFLDIITCLSLAQANGNIVIKEGTKYSLICPFTGEILLTKIGRKNFIVELLKSPELYYKFYVALYLQELNDDIVFTNYRTFHEIARYKTQHMIRNYYDIIGISEEEAEKLATEYDLMPEKMMKQYPVDSFFRKEELLELLKEHGRVSFIWDRLLSDSEKNEKYKQAEKEIIALEKELVGIKKKAKDKKVDIAE